MINKFSETAKRELGEHYVYALIDPRTDKVFYIGKGEGDRFFSHEIEGNKSPESEKIKLKTINDIRTDGKQVKRIIVNWGLTEKEAFAAEAALINLLNYTSDIKLSNIQSGHHVHEALSVEDFELRHGAEQLKEDDIKHKILIIKINKLFKWGMSSKDLYDATRGIWVASLDRVKRDVEYVFAVYNQLIVAVYKPDEWHRVGEMIDVPRQQELKNNIEDGTKKRIYFISRNYDQSEESLDENQKFYRYKSIAGFAINKDAQNPITYLSSSIEIIKKIKIVREALRLLANENKLIYEPEKLPKSDTWIKFETQELKSTFPFDGRRTKWDGEEFSSISYLEYDTSSNSLVITYKIVGKSNLVAENLERYKDELSLLDRKNKVYWHLKRYQVDYEKVCKSLDEVKEMKTQLESHLLKIKEDLNNIASKLG